MNMAHMRFSEAHVCQFGAGTWHTCTPMHDSNCTMQIAPKSVKVAGHGMVGWVVEHG